MNLKTVVGDAGTSELGQAPQSEERKRTPRSRTPKPRKKTLEFYTALLERVLRVGKCTTRQGYYQASSTEGPICPANDKGYDKVQRSLVIMRRMGMLPWDAITDLGRKIHRTLMWGNPGQVVETYAYAYQEDPWKTAPIIPLLVCEKDALSSFFKPLADRFRVPYLADKGFGSESVHLDVARFVENANERGQKVRILFFSDHDPAGFSMVTAIRTHLNHHGARYEFERVAVTMEQVIEHNLLRMPLKAKDTRAPGYRKALGIDWGSELDALDPRELRRLISASVAPMVDAAAWAATEESEARAQNMFRVMGSRWKGFVRLAELGEDDWGLVLSTLPGAWQGETSGDGEPSD